MLDAMLDGLEVIFPILVFIGVVAFLIWRSGRRDRALSAAAAALGMTYRERDDALVDAFRRFKVFDTLGGKSLFNVLEGTVEGVRVCVTDYRYGDKLIGSVQSCGCTLCLLHAEGIDLPHFSLRQRGRPRSFTPAPNLHRAEDDPEVPLPADDGFADEFSMYTRSADAVQALMTRELREQLLADRGSYIEIEGCGDRVIVTERSYLHPGRLEAFIKRATRIAEALRPSGALHA